MSVTLSVCVQWSATDFNLPDCSFKTVVGRFGRIIHALCLLSLHHHSIERALSDQFRAIGSMDVFPLLGSSFSVFFPGVTLVRQFAFAVGRVSQIELFIGR